MPNKLLFPLLVISTVFGQFSQQAKIVASDAAANDLFGYDGGLGVSGNYAIVGAYQNDDNGSSSGSAYIFLRSGSSWSQQAKLTASDGAANDNFGISADISGDYAVVGAVGEDSGVDNSGAVYVFIRSGSSWSQQAKLQPSTAVANASFGKTVAIDGDYVIVGAPDSDSKGAAYIFVRSGSSWSQQAKLVSSDLATSDSFGNDVSISGSYAAVGTPWDDDDGGGSGSAYIFVRSGTSWTQQAKLKASDAAAGDGFGAGVSIDDNYLISGAYQENPNSVANGGSAYIFIRSGSSWSQQAKLVASDVAAGDDGGRVVCMSRLVVNQAPSSSSISKKTKSNKLRAASISLITGLFLFNLGYFSVSKSDANLDPWNLNIPNEFVFGLGSIFISLPMILFGGIFTLIYFIDRERH